MRPYGCCQTARLVVLNLLLSTGPAALPPKSNGKPGEQSIYVKPEGGRGIKGSCRVSDLLGARLATLDVRNDLCSSGLVCYCDCCTGCGGLGQPWTSNSRVSLSCRWHRSRVAGLICTLAQLRRPRGRSSGHMSTHLHRLSVPSSVPRPESPGVRPIVTGVDVQRVPRPSSNGTSA